MVNLRLVTIQTDVRLVSVDLFGETKAKRIVDHSHRTSFVIEVRMGVRGGNNLLRRA